MIFIRISPLFWTTLLFLVLTNVFCAPGDQKDGCKNLTGNWRNQLNSTMNIVHDGSKLVGSYSTAVETQAGNAGGLQRDLMGHVGTTSSESGLIITWTVMWKNGTEATTWNGQCYEDCVHGKTVIRTTWMMRELKNTCNDEWSASRIGQDIFDRV